MIMCRSDTRSLFAVAAVGAALLLSGCGGDPDTGATADSSTSDETSAGSTRPGQIPTEEPGRADGAGGGESGGTGGGVPGSEGSGTDGRGSGTDGRAGSGGAGGGNVDGTDSGGGGAGGSGDDSSGDEESAVEVAGPTLDNDYPEYFGNIYLQDRSKCAIFATSSEHDVTVRAVSVTSPLVLTTSCSPDSGEPAAPGCGPGVQLAAQYATGCTLGVVFAPGTDFAQNYLPHIDWRLSTSCTDTSSPPCDEPAVAASHPSTAAPVAVTWTMRTALRYCGGTDYADADGNPGTGGPPTDGCTAGTAGSSSAAPGAG